MQSKLLKSSAKHEYIQAEWSGVNESGYEPIDEIVLVLPDSAAEVTSGGVFMTPDAVEKNTMAAETGVIIAIADGAFRWNAGRSRPWNGYRPQPGDRVYMQRYSGQVLLGEDQRLYRACSDNCIAAVKRKTSSVAALNFPSLSSGALLKMLPEEGGV